MATVSSLEIGPVSDLIQDSLTHTNTDQTEKLSEKNNAPLFDPKQQ